MSDFQVCKICKDYDFLSKHKCDPVYQCFISDEHEDDARSIHAASACQAAEKFGSNMCGRDSDMYSEFSGGIFGNGGQKITVISPDGTRKNFRVWSKEEINFYSEEQR